MPSLAIQLPPLTFTIEDPPGRHRPCLVPARRADLNSIVHDEGHHIGWPEAIAQRGISRHEPNRGANLRRPAPLETRLGMATQLRGYVEQLNSLGRNCTQLGSWPGPRLCWNGYFHSRIGSHLPPPLSFIDTVTDFHAFWKARVEEFVDGANFSCTSDIVLIHRDVNSENIMCKDGRISGVVDWDTFGWYPHFWEKMTLWRGGQGWTTAVDIRKVNLVQYMNTDRMDTEGAVREPYGSIEEDVYLLRVPSRSVRLLAHPMVSPSPASYQDLSGAFPFRFSLSSDAQLE
ncbi:hypothetical protein B0H19DRAFT_1230525 [Mycena capillaripes]|nr:hypothetical protein B0H19DRAFT_1230525 [Mycena capillaripes]